MLEEVKRKKKNIFRIIQDAGNEVIKVYHTDDFQVEIKNDQTPLTLADKRSNKVIGKGLEKLFPKLPILSEENKKIAYYQRKKWKYFWLIDPLDGTKEFIKKNGNFSINLALIQDGYPIFGILYLPVSKKFYYAAKGEGAYKIKADGKSLRLPLEEEFPGDPGKALRIIHSQSNYNRQTKAYVAAIKKRFGPVALITAGSAMKFTYLAEGKADIYPRMATTMEWDIAAGQILLEEAGGKVLDFKSKQPLVYNKKDLRNPWFVATGVKKEYSERLREVALNDKEFPIPE